MIEMLFVYQLALNPLQAMARRWYCRSLYRASRGANARDAPNRDGLSRRGEVMISNQTVDQMWNLTTSVPLGHAHSRLEITT